MQQRARDLDAPCLAAGQRPHFVAGTFGEPDLRKRFDRAAVAFTPADPLQRRMIGEVLQQLRSLSRLRL